MESSTWQPKREKVWISTEWILILSFAAATLAISLAGFGQVVNVAFPVLSVALAFYFQKVKPNFYVGFIWWLWFLCPLVRRIADYYANSFTDPSPILLTPYLVILVGLVQIKHFMKMRYLQLSLPFLLGIAGVTYGFVIGLINRPLVTASLNYLEWVAPILFGLYIALNWRLYPLFKRNLYRIFAVGVFVMGAYGIIQYCFAPEWDRFWIISAELNTIGQPVPFGIRVYSTMNSVEPFAAMMTAGLILLMGGRTSAMTIPASVAGYLSFLLSMARSGWISWLVGMTSLMVKSRPKAQMRLLITIAVIALAVIPIVLGSSWGDGVIERISTLSDVQNDGSANIRQENFADLIGTALTSVVGEGAGGSTFDSAFLSLLINFGWIGTLPYITGLLMLAVTSLQMCKRYSDEFFYAAYAIFLSSIVRLPVNVPVLAASGCMLWGAMGLTIAGATYYARARAAAEAQTHVASNLPTAQIYTTSV